MVHVSDALDTMHDRQIVSARWTDSVSQRDAGELTLGEGFDGNLAGPRSHRYGEPRDVVLGMTVELADGTVARCGGRVVKNVAGYDLARLFTGARGRLGAIRQLALRLHPLPAATCTLVAPVGDPLPLERLAPACV